MGWKITREMWNEQKKNHQKASHSVFNSRLDHTYGVTEWE